jgi:hypothetical protein
LAYASPPPFWWWGQGLPKLWLQAEKASLPDKTKEQGGAGGGGKEKELAGKEEGNANGSTTGAERVIFDL